MTKRLSWLICIVYFLICTTATFGDVLALDWAKCWELALKNNRDILNARALLETVDTNYLMARSGYWPAVGIGSSVSQSGGSSDTHSLLSISVSQPLFPGLFSRPDVKRQMALSEAEKLLVLDTLSIKRYAIFSAFLETAYLQETVKLTSQILQKRSQNVALVKARFEAGREHKGSYLRALAQYKQAALDVRHSTQQLELSKKKLGQMIQVSFADGLEIKTDVSGPNLVSVSYTFPDLRQPDLFAIYSESIPSVLRQYFLYQASIFAVSSKKDEFWPKLSASLSVSQALDESLSSFDNDQISARLSLSYAYEWRKVRKAELRDVMTQESIQRLEWFELREKKALEIEESAIDIQNSIDNLSLQQEFLDASLTRSEIANAQYKNGLLTYDNWDLIESDVISQQRQLLIRLKELSLSRARLALTLGFLDQTKLGVGHEEL